MKKKTKTWLRIVALLLALLLLGSTIYLILDSVIMSAGATSLDELNEQQEEIEEEKRQLAEQQQDLAAKRTALQTSINNLKNDIAATQQQKEDYDRLIIVTEEELDNLGRQIAVLEAEIEIKRQEYEAAAAEEESRWKTFCAQLRSMEESGDITYLDILLGGVNSFADLLSRLDMVDEVNARSEQLIDEMEVLQQEVALAQQALYDAKGDCEDKQAEQEELQQEYEALREESTKLILKLEGQLEEEQQSAQELAELAAELERQERQLEAEAYSLLKQIEEMERQELMKNAGVNATGTYLWPSSDSYYVTSLFGTRYHPILHYWRTHSGIDIGAPYDTYIYASDGGIVVTSESSYSYGNYVMIAHGNGRYTLYAHMNKRLVSVDDVVKQGDVIGLVGSTGYSTGPHIHFEIIENGERVDPLQYFTNYVVYDS